MLLGIGEPATGTEEYSPDLLNALAVALCYRGDGNLCCCCCCFVVIFKIIL